MQWQTRDGNSTTDSPTTGRALLDNSATSKRKPVRGATSDNVIGAGNKVFSLETTFNGTRRSNGAMFDVSTKVGDHAVKIVSLDIHTDIVQDDCHVVVLGRAGSHVGFENVTKGWSLLVNDTVKCVGFGKRTSIPSSLFRKNPTLRNGESYAFYTLMGVPGLRYTEGGAVGKIYSSSRFLNIHIGTGVGEFFGGQKQLFERPRVWNGVVKYRVINDDLPIKDNFLASCNSKLTTSYDDQLGSFGNMFDVVTHNASIKVHGIDIYTDLRAAVTYEIFTRLGTYKDGMPPSKKKNNSTDNAVENAVFDDNATNVENMINLNWTLVRRGNVIGRGSGRGTPIRDFIPFTIPPASRQAFYVTLTKPDLRYQDIKIVAPALRAGDVYYTNQDMAILVGVSVGTYPATSVIFGPRLWSGTFFYDASHECPSAAPSEVPSLTPSIAPSQEPTSSPSMGVLQDLGNCTDRSTLETILDGGTESYGIMFTVTSSVRVNLTSIDIHAATTDDIYVEVYTKIGDYRGFEDDPSSWQSVAAVSVIGAGEGQLTVIPDEYFEDVPMGANETRAYYVTMSTAYMKYSRSSVKVGKAIIGDDHIVINSGAGLTAADFGGSVYSPRSFNGALHYLHKDDCVDNVNTFANYHFNVQHLGSVTEDEISESVNANIIQTVKGILAIDTALRVLNSEYGLELKNSSTFPSQSTTCTTSRADSKCKSLETHMLFSHADTMDPGQLLLIMLRYRDTVERKLSLAGIQADYDGDIPVQSEIVVSLKGDFTTELRDSELLYFQAIARSYLKAKLAADGVDILNVQAQHSARVRILQRDDNAPAGSSSSIDVTTIVVGSYRPPPEIDFGGTVVDALDAEGGRQFIDDLVTSRRDIPEDIARKAGAMKTVTSVESKAIRQSTISPASEVADGNSKTAILGGVFGFILVVFLITVRCYCNQRKKGRKRGHLFNMCGTLSGMSHGKPSHKSSECLVPDAFEAECVFVDDDPCMKEHLFNASRRTGSHPEERLGSSSELRRDWKQDPSLTLFEGMQKHTLPKEWSPHSQWNSPMSLRDLATSSDRRGPPPPLTEKSLSRSHRNMEMGGSNNGSIDFQTSLESSISIIERGGRSPMTSRTFDRRTENANRASHMDYTHGQMT